LRGAHQRQNAALAIAAAQALGEHGVVVRDDAIGRGIARLRWPGRFEIVPGAPTIVLDGAHNDGAALALAEAMRHEFPRRAVRLVVGMMRDKDAAAFARAMAPLARSVYATMPEGSRALDAKAADSSQRSRPA
jgi:dihydrofolate synthase/folylpolyglutamate synthase